MRKSTIENLLIGVKKEFYLNDFENGDCLNLAVSLHDYLKSKGITSHVLPIMRNAAKDDMTAVFDHAALFIEIEGQSIAKGFNPDYTFDANGSNAYVKWVKSSPFYDEQNMMFWINSPPRDLEEFCKLSQEKHGDTIMKKLLNNKILRNGLMKYFNSINQEIN